jgi:hypothetical protein
LNDTPAHLVVGVVDLLRHQELVLPDRVRRRSRAFVVVPREADLKRDRPPGEKLQLRVQQLARSVHRVLPRNDPLRQQRIRKLHQRVVRLHPLVVEPEPVRVAASRVDPQHARRPRPQITCRDPERVDQLCLARRVGPVEIEAPDEEPLILVDL